MLITLAAAGATTALAVYVIKKIDKALTTFYEDESEDLPPGVEGYDPTWRKLLPPEVLNKLDALLAQFPQGWWESREDPKMASASGTTYEKVQADQ